MVSSGASAGMATLVQGPWDSTSTTTITQPLFVVNSSIWSHWTTTSASSNFDTTTSILFDTGQFTTATTGISLGGSWTTNALFTVLEDPPEVIAQREARRLAVATKAERLWQRILTGKQTGTWRRWGFIDLPSRIRPGVVYRIPKTGLVAEFVQGAPARSLCVHAIEGLPDGDKWLALKCFIEADEAEFLAVAIPHATRDLRGPHRPMIRALPVAA